MSQLLTLPRRKVGETLDLKQSLAQIGEDSPTYDYQNALRRRLSATNQIGQQQNEYSARKRVEADQAKYQQQYQQQLQAMQSASNQSNWSPAKGPAKPGQGWYSPIQGYKPTFGYGQHYKNSNLGDVHHGIDFAVPVGTPIYAPSGGKIILAGWDPYGGKSGGFGTSIRMQNADGTYTIIGHLSNINKGIRPGMVVTPGMLLGHSGNTGNSSGAHAHIEMRTDLYDKNTSFDFSNLFGW